MGRRERHKRRTRQLLIDTAHELVNEHGYGDTTIQMIAETADVSPRTVFRYFRNKPALILAPTADVIDDLLDRIPEHCDGEATVDGLLAALVEHFEMLDGYDRLEVHLQWTRTDRELGAELARIRQRATKRIALLLAEQDGRAEPDIRHTTLAAVTMALSMAALEHWHLTDGSEPPAHFLEQAISSGGWPPPDSA